MNKRIFGCFLILVMILGMIPFNSALAAFPIKVIFDTDITSDCDDAGAMAMLHEFADRGEISLLGMICDVYHNYGAPCLDAMNTYFGRPDIPIGALKDTDLTKTSKYAQYIAQNWPNDLQSGTNAPDATALYRQLLAGQPDGGVVIIAVGPLRTLRNLLQSGPDGYSSLNGRDLVAQKVFKLSCMGGTYPGGSWESNFCKDGASTDYVVANWPTPIMFSGWEIGNPIVTGKRLFTETPESNPVRKAYDLYFNGVPSDRPSWDQTSVLYAVRGLSNFWNAVTTGYNDVAADGINTWRSSPDSEHSYLTPLMSNAGLKTTIEDLMVAAGASGGSVSLLSQGKTATASSFAVGYEPNKGNDGDPASRWGASSSTYPQWWKVDLGSSKSLARLDTAWYSSSSRAYKYKVEVSSDDLTYTLKVDNTSNTTYGDTFDSFTATARYLKVTVTGSNTGWAGFNEFKVYGNDLSASTPTPAPTPAPGLIAYWALNETSGTIASDSVGSHTGTTVNSPVWTAGKIGNCLSFDGVDDYVRVNHSSDLAYTNTQSFSLAAWVYVSTLPGKWSGIVTKGRETTTWYGLWIDPSNRWTFGGKDNGTACNVFGNTVATGWRHLVAVQNGAANQRLLFVDGVQQGSGYAANGNSTSEFWIGGAKTVSEYLNGKVDEVRFYNYALSASEVQNLYYQGTAAPTATPTPTMTPTPTPTPNATPTLTPAGSLVAYWALNESSGTLAADSTGRGHSGTLYGNTGWAAGHNGNAAVFDGNGDYIIVPHSSDFAYTSAQSFTLTAWVYVNSLPGGWVGIVTKGRETTVWYGIWINTDNKWTCGAKDGSSYYNMFGGTVTTGVWHHVAIVQNGPANQRILYVDGAQSVSGASHNANSTSELWIGCAKTTTEYLNGKVDEVRFYNYALSSSEIQSLYNQ